jgi:hypothetical protein
MPLNKSFPAILYLRVFIEHVELDLIRPGKGLALQLRVLLNIPEKDAQSDDIEQQDIPTLVRFFSDLGQSDIYHENSFIYAWGSFLIATTQD